MAVSTRGAPRAKTETPVPVDVIKINQVDMPTAKMDITSILNVSAPSFNYNKQSGADGADHVDLGPVALALVKRGLPAETQLTTGPQAAVAAVIDADSLPATKHIGAGRLAVERLRGGAR